jgi:chromosome segregation ATPase
MFKIGLASSSFSSPSPSRYATYLVIISETYILCGQAYVSLRADHDKVEATLEQKTTFVSSLETKVSELEGRHATAQKQLTSLTSELQSLRLEKSSLRSQVDDHFGTIAGLRKAAAQSISNEEELNRQLHQTQGELRNAIRRAEEAERIQHELQTEGSTLMRCLDEMRPKIVELTNAKLELSEKTNILEQAVRDRDGVIVQLETSLQAAQDQNESLNTKLLDAESAREKDLSTAQETQDELQRGYAQLETELSEAHASIRELEVERAGRRQLASKQVEDLDRMASASQSLKGEIASLQQELEERKLADVEQQEFLERARTDIEVLRADLVTKVQEIDELRAELSIAAANSAPSPSLDKEMMNALKQQHRLELSAAQSQIRALQTAIFEAEARAHSFQRQLGQSEDQLAQLRASSSPSSSHVIPRPFTPDHPSRPSSRARNHSDDLRRVSLTQRRGSNNVSLNSTHSTFGANLSPETRHKRKVSLGMLKARIDSEMAAAAIPPSRAASPQHVGDADSTSPALIPYATTNIHDAHKRPQFLDESHIFWCHSCRGELVVL